MNHQPARSAATFPHPSRRDVLRLLGLSAAGVGAGAWLDLDRTARAAFRSQAAPPAGYKALVCVFLEGGNDSHNLLVPRSASEYSQYAAGRTSLALPLEQLLPIDPVTSDGIDYGLAPQLTGVQNLFGEGKLAVLRNVGSLVEPATKAQLEEGSVALPPQLFSHKDQRNYWQTALPDPGGKVGWGGRMSDLVAASNAVPALTNVSVAGSNLLQVGNQSSFYAMGPEGPSELNGFIGEIGPIRKLAFETLLATPSDSPLARAYADLQIEAAEIESLLSQAFGGVPELVTQFPGSVLGRQLRRIALSIAASGSLGLERQLFFARKSGFDNHSDLIQSYPGLLADLDASLLAFQRAMEELGLEDEVVLFTASDFGRSLSSNGQGSDHGWGGHGLVMGAPVNGAELYGRMPELALDGPDDVGAGRLIPTTSIDEVGATLASWYGVAPADLSTVFPNLSNFASSDLGFLKSLS